MHRIAQLAIVLASAAALAWPAAGSALPTATPSRPCGTVSGPAVGANKTGKYSVVAFGASCSFAKQGVAKILHTRLPDARLASFAGPAGWRCVSPAVTKHVALSGSCQSPGLPHRGFVWGAGR
jgi:hypothetical protein